MGVGGLAVFEEGELSIFGGAVGDLEASCCEELISWCYRDCCIAIMQQCCLQVRSDQKVEYFPLSASSSTTTSKLLPAAERAETKLRRPKSRPNVNDRIVVVCAVCIC